MPIVMAPALMVLFWADIRAQRIGALSISASSYAGRTQGEEQQTYLQLWKSWWIQIDAFGLIILGFGLALILLPFTLYRRVEHEWNNRE
jgi:hypothetical protein